MLVFLLILCFSVACEKAQISKTYTVGVVNLNPDLDKVFLGFKEKLAGLGYREGKNINSIV